jgi:hypothetical protein
MLYIAVPPSFQCCERVHTLADSMQCSIAWRRTDVLEWATLRAQRLQRVCLLAVMKRCDDYFPIIDS